MRYLRSSPAVYIAACAQLDAAYGYPNPDTATERSLPPVGELPVDSLGRVYVAVASEFCEYVLPSQMLPELIASGAVEEVGEADYLALLPPSPYG